MIIHMDPKALFGKRDTHCSLSIEHYEWTACCNVKDLLCQNFIDVGIDLSLYVGMFSCALVATSHDGMESSFTLGHQLEAL